MKLSEALFRDLQVLHPSHQGVWVPPEKASRACLVRAPSPSSGRDERSQQVYAAALCRRDPADFWVSMGGVVDGEELIPRRTGLIVGT